jgi:hypothetical protein
MNRLNENITEINQRVKEKEMFLNNEIQNLEQHLNAEIEKNIEKDKTIAKLTAKMKYSMENSKKDESGTSLRNNESSQNIQIKKLEKELIFVKKLLSDKQEECESIQKDLKNTLKNVSYRHSDNELITKRVNIEIQKREDELSDMRLKYDELERKNKKYYTQIKEMKEIFESRTLEYKYEINKKSEEMQILKMNYEKTIHEVNIKLLK